MEMMGGPAGTLIQVRAYALRSLQACASEEVRTLCPCLRMCKLKTCCSSLPTCVLHECDEWLTLTYVQIIPFSCTGAWSHISYDFLTDSIGCNRSQAVVDPFVMVCLSVPLGLFPPVGPSVSLPPSLLPCPTICLSDCTTCEMSRMSCCHFASLLSSPSLPLPSPLPCCRYVL